MNIDKVIDNYNENILPLKIEICLKDKEIEKLNNIIDELEKLLENPYNVDCINQNNDFLRRIKELKEGK